MRHLQACLVRLVTARTAVASAGLWSSRAIDRSVFSVYKPLVAIAIATGLALPLSLHAQRAHHRQRFARVTRAGGKLGKPCNLPPKQAALQTHVDLPSRHGDEVDDLRVLLAASFA